jgi:ADP-dependent NAD(P)H-hydrate dehydratase / NAD(P)H-hydrate epimerase
MRIVVTAAEIREMDRRTIEEIGIPGIVLMENAGRATFELCLAAHANGDGGPVAILCGAGNNGGDGYVVARHLHQAGVPCVVCLLADREQVAGDARTNLDVLSRLPVPLLRVGEDLDALSEEILRASVIVDALLGTGLRAGVDGRLARLIELANDGDAFKVAVDIPSGVRADDGAVLGAAFKADVTVTFGAPKLGLYLHPGAAFAGEVVVADIGIPPQVRREVGGGATLIERDELLAFAAPRARDGHKGSYGHCLVLAGSPGKSGAALLAGQGALHCGAGLVTVATHPAVLGALEGRVAELMLCAWPEDEEALDGLLRGKAAVVVGPGLGTSPGAGDLVTRLLSRARVPLVLDADALNLLAPQPGAVARAAAPCLLTPHPGEMARLLDRSVADIQADRLGAARALAAREHAVVVLKGAPTVVASPDGGVALNTNGNPGMGTAGTGDVLSGLLGALLAQGLSPDQAARVGVFLHGAAGDAAAAQTGERAMTAGALVAHLGGVLAQAEQENPL